MAQARVQALLIVPHPDPHVDILLRFLPHGVVLIAHKLNLQRVEEALDHGIVETVAPSAHAAHHLPVPQPMLVSQARVLRATIRVHEQVQMRILDRHGPA